MPGHTPEEKAKNAAARSIQPAPDRQGGSAAVSNDAGSQSTFQKWRDHLRTPVVRAGLFQFAAQMLQTNPGGFGPAFRTSLAAGLGAAGRFTKLERERGQEREERLSSKAQQGFENKLAERKQIEVEKRTEILGRPRVGRGGRAAPEGNALIQRLGEWRSGFETQLADELGGGPVNPIMLDRLAQAALEAESEGVMDFAISQNRDPLDVARAWLDPAKRAKLIAASGGDGGGKVGDGATAGDVSTKLTPGERTPSAVRGAGESPKDFEARQQKQKATETTRVETLGTQDEAQRLGTDTANRQGQVDNFVKGEIASGRRTEEEIAELLIQRGFTDPASLDFLEATYPGLWDIVRRRLAGG